MIDSVPYTPALVIDLATVKRNLARLAQYGQKHGIAIRPHTKTHKSVAMGTLQVEYGSTGLTVAKVGEAAIMREACSDLLIAYPIIDVPRISRLVELGRKTTVRVAVDSHEAAAAIADAASTAGVTVGILVDQDVGFHRTGLQTSSQTLELAQMVDRSAGLRLDGLFTYPGHVWKPPAEQVSELSHIDELINNSKALWAESGLQMQIVSGGSTPTAYQSHHITSVTEIRPGTYIYNDMNTARAGFCELADCAARIVCTIVSTAVPGKAVIDAGTKTLTSDRNVLHPDSGYGHVIEYPQAKIIRCSEEHGELDITQCDRAPRLGERVTVVPNHICPCVNLQGQMFVHTESGKLECWPVNARGKLS